MFGVWHHIVLWFQTEYVPRVGPFYDGQTWGNVFVAPVAFGLGWLWTKTRFWPLKPLEHGLDRVHEHVSIMHQKHDTLHDKHDALSQRVEDLHAKLDRITEAMGGTPEGMPPHTSNPD